MTEIRFPLCLVHFKDPKTASNRFWPRTVRGVRNGPPMLRNIAGPFSTPPADRYSHHGLDAIFVM